jgi:hypothetical protein
MSIRRRAIQNRLARDLAFEQGNHRATRGLLDATQVGFKKALEERDEARVERDRHAERLAALTGELGRYFTDPPPTLSRDSNLFHLLEEIAPGSIPPLPPTPKEMLDTMLNAAGVTMEEVADYVQSGIEAAGAEDDEETPT